jgi:hypothetical protein
MKYEKRRANALGVPLHQRGQSLKIRKIPIQDEHSHPPRDSVLPQHEFTCLVTAPKGLGKTTFGINMLLNPAMYYGYFHRIYVMSPTIDNDSKWNLVKQTRGILVENKPLKQFLREQMRKSKRQVSQIHNAVVFECKKCGGIDCTKHDGTDEPPFDGRIPEDCFMTNFEVEDLEDILAEQDAMIAYLRRHGHDKYMADRIAFFLDDQVGSSLFTNRPHDSFTRFIVRHRHYNASAWIMTQCYRAIPRKVRVNTSALITMRLTNAKEIEALYEENPCGLTQEEFTRVLHHCTQSEDGRGFLYINYQRPLDKMLMRNFETVITTNPNGPVPKKEELVEMLTPSAEHELPKA